MAGADGEVLRQEPPTQLIAGDVTIGLPGLRFGEGLRLRARIHAAPYVNARVLYEGQSETFNFQAGEDVRLTIMLEPVTTDPALPPGPSSPSADLVSHRRAPWGQGGQPPQETVIGGPGATEPGRRVVVFDALDVAAGTELASTAAGPDGAFAIPLPGPAERVFVAAAEGAALLSDHDPGQTGLQAAPVTRVEWTASFGSKVAGSTFRNPHTLSVTRRFEPSLQQSSSSLSELTTEAYGQVFGGGPGTEVTPVRRWLEAPRPEGPSPRASAKMAFDPVRGRTVLFGGFRNETDLGDTWEWDGRAWRRTEIPGANPSARGGHAMVYSDREQAVVLFGGFRDPDALRDLWTYDGQRWQQRSEAPPEVAGIGAQVAYDPSGRRLVLFGGCFDTACESVSNQTWSWDGETWQRINDGAAGVPPPSNDGRMVALPDGRLLLSALRGADGPVVGTWILDGDQWRAVDGPQPMPPRRSPTMVVREDDVALFGGLGDDALSDVWIFRDGAWVEEQPMSSPPPGRFFHAAAYDRHRGQMVVFGGTSPDFTDDTWVYQGRAWTSVGANRTAEAGPLRAAAAYNDNLGGVLLFGGLDASGRVENRMRLWNGERWLELSAGGPQPPGVDGAAAAFDPVEDWFVLFGGVDEGGTRLGTTWVLRREGFEGLTWRTFSTPPELTARGGHAMAYSPELGGVVLFGGFDGRNRADTWLLDGTGWRQVAAEGAGAPSPRSFAELAFDERLGAVVLAGGRPRENTFDVWLLDQAGWRRVAISPAASQPGPRSEHQLVYDPRLGETVLFGGCDFARGGCIAGYGDVWTFDGQRWLSRTPRSTVAPARYGHLAAYDPSAAGVLIYGGQDTASGAALSGTWALLTADASVAQWSRLDAERRSPAPRAEARLAYEPRLGRTLLYGGCYRLGCVSPLADTWEWTGTTWLRRRHESGDLVAMGSFGLAPGPGQGLVAGFAGFYWQWSGAAWTLVDSYLQTRLLRQNAVYDPVADRTLFYGGILGDSRFGLVEWSDRGFRTIPQSGPRREGLAVTFDERHARLVAFGGCTDLSCRVTSDELLQWKDDEGWAPVERTEPWPPGRGYGSLVYDSVSERSILFGGVGDRILGDVWAWNGERWEELLTEGSAPTLRTRHAATFDRRRGEMVIFGGFVDDVTLGDTWALPTDAGLRPAFVASFDVSASVSGLALDRVTRLVVRGSASATPQIKVWRATDSRWVDQAVPGPTFQVELDTADDSERWVTGAEAVHVAIVPTAGGSTSSIAVSQLELVVTTE